MMPISDQDPKNDPLRSQNQSVKGSEQRSEQGLEQGSEQGLEQGSEQRSKQEEFYQALLDKNSAYEGIFFVGVSSTGIFCRPTCPARKPKRENCTFFKTAQEALLASFRPCKRCEPLLPPGYLSDQIRKLVEAVESYPEKRWKEKDFEDLCLDPSTARRHFKKHYGMTFVAYARARRMGIALKQIREGGSVIQAQLEAGYESGSGFRDAFSKIMGASPAHINPDGLLLKASWLSTPLGPMLAIGDEKKLYLLEFVDRRGLEREIEALRLKTKAPILPGRTAPITSIEKELDDYFKGRLKAFQTPLYFLGTPFQKTVWDELLRIPYGETRSYQDQASSLGNPAACRAVANANGKNQLAIIIPCHRIIRHNGELGGYGGNPVRKKWLLDHERAHR